MKRGTPQHPKTAALALALDCGIPAAVGYLEMLWHFAARYAPQGDIGRYPDGVITAAMHWSGEPAQLVRTLVEKGWIDDSTEFRLVVHDWHDHADNTTKKYVQRNRLRWASRTRRVRTSNGHGQDRVSLQDHPAVPSRAVPEPAPEPKPEPTDPGAPAPIPELPPNGLAKTLPDPDWSREFADDWRGSYGQEAAPLKEHFAQVKQALRKFQWERVRPVLRWYLAESPAEYVNLPKFFAAFPSWERRMGGDERTRGAGKPSLWDQQQAENAKFLKGAKG